MTPEPTKRLLIALVLFLPAMTLRSFGQDPPAGKTVRLKVMTYNIKVGAGGDKSAPRLAGLEPVAKVIEGEQPDLVGLQEVDRHRKRSGGVDQPAWLAKRLGMQVAYEAALRGDPKTPGRDEYGLAVLSRFPIRTSERRPLFKPEPRADLPERLLEQRILQSTTILAEGIPIRFLNTHLGLAADQRREQIRQITETGSKGTGALILTGDFNARPEEPGIRPLYDSFREAKAEAGLKGESTFTIPGGPSPTASIDHIFVSPEFRILSAKVIRDGTRASDHNPVVAELELNIETPR